jgi:hypothetical protein
MKSKFVLLAFAVLMPLLGNAAVPAIKVISPKANANRTNGVISATGTAKSALPIAGVWYSFNGAAWTSATGLTNWSVPNLQLTPGSNSLSVYAADTGNAFSKTNKINFTYVVNVLMTVHTNGNGFVAPNYDGQSLQIGKKYVMNAKAAKGFGFSGWTRNGQATADAAHTFFLMESNLTFTANFIDTARPLCVVTFPAVKHSVSNSPITATCRASDNVGVTALSYRLNGGDWEADATSADGTNWSIANLTLTPGANTLQAYARDAVGNVSLTNSVVFNFVSNAPPPVSGFAPASLSGLVGLVTGALDDNSNSIPPFEISFGTSTFAVSVTNLSGDMHAKVGNYAYTLLSSNSARVTTLNVFPPADADGHTKSMVWTFTNGTTCVSTESAGNTVSITLSPAGNRVPSPSSIVTVQTWPTSDPATINTTVMAGGGYTNYLNYGTGSQTADNWGTYSLEPFSPVAAMLRMQSTNGGGPVETYTLLSFKTFSNGDWFARAFDTSASELYADVGSFTIVNSANPPAGFAPMEISGKLITVTQGGKTFKVCFGDYTHTAFDSNTNDNNSNIEDYTYMKTGANTALLFSTTILPPNNGNFGDQSVERLDFTSSTKGTATAVDDPNKTASFTVAIANNYAPTSMAGRKISSSKGSVTFYNDGTCLAGSNSQQDQATYIYAQCSPLGGMIILTHSDGSTTYLQAQFANATSGSWYETDFDNLGNFNGLDSGTFTLQ